MYTAKGEVVSYHMLVRPSDSPDVFLSTDPLATAPQPSEREREREREREARERERERGGGGNGGGTEGSGSLARLTSGSGSGGGSGGGNGGGATGSGNGNGNGSGHYDPYYLDDPQIRTGIHRTVMSLESMLFSVIPFVKPKELKEELNEQFRIKHEWLAGTQLTLSKIRNLKREMLEVGLENVRLVWFLFWLSRLCLCGTGMVFCVCAETAFCCGCDASDSVILPFLCVLMRSCGCGVV